MNVPTYKTTAWLANARPLPSGAPGVPSFMTAGQPTGPGSSPRGGRGPLRAIGGRGYFRPQAIRLPARLSRTDAQAARAAARALRPMVRRILARVLGPLGLVAPDIGLFLWRRVTAPDGFPGFDNIVQGWTNFDGVDPHTGPYPEPGTYVDDFAPASDWSQTVDQLLDQSDQIPLTFKYRYWGHMHAGDPYVDPDVQGTNWPVVTAAVPMLQPQPVGKPVRYNRPADLSGVVGPPPPGARNFFMEAGPGVPGGVRGGKDHPSRRPRLRRHQERETKVRFGPVLSFLWHGANALGELVEWLDILAEASEFHRDSLIIPEDLRGTHAAKLWWLFEAGGIKHLDLGLLSELILENEVEDSIYGALGQLSGHTARNFHLTVGPQTGPAI